MSLITARKTGRGCSVAYMDVLFCRNRPRKMPCIHFFRVIAANSLKPSSINRALLLRKRRITGNWRLSVINAPVPLPFFFFSVLFLFFLIHTYFCFRIAFWLTFCWWRLAVLFDVSLQGSRGRHYSSCAMLEKKWGLKSRGKKEECGECCACQSAGHVREQSRTKYPPSGVRAHGATSCPNHGLKAVVVLIAMAFTPKEIKRERAAFTKKTFVCLQRGFLQPVVSFHSCSRADAQSALTVPYCRFLFCVPVSTLSILTAWEMPTAHQRVWRWVCILSFAETHCIY